MQRAALGVVGLEETYPEQARHLIMAERPGREVFIDVVPFWYPYAGHLDVKLRVALRRHPHVLVVEIPAGPVVIEHTGAGDLQRFPRHIRSAYQRVRYLRALGRELLGKHAGGRGLVSIVDWSIKSMFNGPL